MRYLDDFANAFWILFHNYLYFLAAASTVGGLLLGAFHMIISPLRRRLKG